MPVETADFVFAEKAARRHHAEQLFDGFGKMLRLLQRAFENFREQIFRQQARVFGKETEDDAIEKPGDAKIFLLREVHLFSGFGIGQFDAFAALQRLGDGGNLPGNFFSDLRGGALRLEKFRIGEKRAENAEIFRAVNLVVGEFVNFLNRAVKIGFDEVAVKIADDKQGRIQQRFTVAEKLFVSLVEIFLFAFVFPAETALFPNVGKTAFRRLAGVRCFNFQKFRVFDHALLKTERIRARRIGFVWRRLAEQAAKVGEMFLIGGGFLALEARPFLFEFSGGHGSVANSESFIPSGMTGSVRRKSASVNSRRGGWSPNLNRHRNLNLL